MLAVATVAGFHDHRNGINCYWDHEVVEGIEDGGELICVGVQT